MRGHSKQNKLFQGLFFNRGRAWVIFLISFFHSFIPFGLKHWLFLTWTSDSSSTTVNVDQISSKMLHVAPTNRKYCSIIAFYYFCPLDAGICYFWPEHQILPPTGLILRSQFWNLGPNIQTHVLKPIAETLAQNSEGHVIRFRKTSYT